MEFFLSYKQFWDPVLICLAYILISFTVLDIILIYLIRSRKPSFRSRYFNIHRRYGFHKVNILKVVLVLFVASTIRGANVGAILLLIPVYCIQVAKLLIDFIRETKAG